jgi:predicted small secreted protein
MINSINHPILLHFAVAVQALISMGCNTARGFGQDSEAAGDTIQEGAD